MIQKHATTLQAAFLVLVATLVAIGLFAVLGEAAEWVLGALWFGFGAWAVGKQMAKRAE